MWIACLLEKRHVSQSHHRVGAPDRKYWSVIRACLMALAFVIGTHEAVAAADHYGRVTFGAVPVPGATVTATQGDQTRATVTDVQGVYRLADIAGGVWALRIEMLGFATLTREITIAPDSPSPTFALTLLPFDEITRGLPRTTPEPIAPARTPIAGRRAGTVPAPPASAAPRSGFQ